MADYSQYFIEPRSPHAPMDHYPSRPAKKVDQKPVNIFTLFPNIDRWAIGYDQMFNQLEKMAVSKAAGFPPYNITKDEDKYEITMALAGYKKDQLSIRVEDRTLIVETVNREENEELIDKEVLHQGIAQRNFTSKFVLGEYVQVKSAKLEDGLLFINLELELPEEKKPRQITIK